HMQGSSLPVGGETTHAVISAHRGLPSAKLFSDLNLLVEGDEFTVTVLKDVYTYEVEEIFIVLPGDTEKLSIMPEKDYLTLTTCTPYGINSHRLLVRAKRIETLPEAAAAQKPKITAEAVQIDSLAVVPFVAAPLVLLLLIWWTLSARLKRKRVFPHSDPLSVFEENNDNDKEKNVPADSAENDIHKGG
ncbi:MAG: sortase, partial [Oscillospiraceae bacterium]